MGTPIKLKHTAADPVRLSFPDLWEATEFEPGSKKRFNANLLVKPDGANAKVIEAAILAAATEEFDGKTAKAVAFVNANRGNSNKYCYTSGDAKEYDGYAGMMVLSAHRPAQQGKYPGVRCSMSGVFFAADGDHFSGGKTSDADEFDVADGADSTDDLA